MEEIGDNILCKRRKCQPQMAAIHSSERRKIRLIESNAKCRYLKKLNCKGPLRQGVHLSEAPSQVFVWGGKAILQTLNLVRNRVASSCRIWSCLQHNSTPPPPTSSQPHTFCLYCTVLLIWEGGGGQVNQRERQRGNSSQSWVKNTNMTDCISSL